MNINNKENKDILIFVSHLTEKVKIKGEKEKVILDIGTPYGYADPYLDYDTNIITTGLCRNTNKDSLQNKIYNFVKKEKKKGNIYIIYFWKRTNRITFIMKVNKSKIFKNHKEAYDKGFLFWNNIKSNKKIKKDYPSCEKHPYIVWKLVSNTMWLKIKKEGLRRYKIGYSNGGTQWEARSTGYIRENENLNDFFNKYVY